MLTRACPAIALSLLCGTLASAQPSEPEFDRTLIGDWVVECLPEGSASEGCQLYQRVLTEDQNVVAMVVTFVWSEERQNLQTQIALPLGVVLGFQPKLAIGEEFETTLGWSRCISDGCLVEGYTDDQTLNLLLESETASIDVLHPLEGVISIPVSLAGFAEALEAIK